MSELFYLLCGVFIGLAFARVFLLPKVSPKTMHALDELERSADRLRETIASVRSERYGRIRREYYGEPCRAGQLLIVERDGVAAAPGPRPGPPEPC